ESPMARALSLRVAAIHKLLLERPASWVPAGDGDWDGLLLGAWRQAEAEVTERLGPDRARWSWGALNVMTVQHPLAHALSVLGPLLSPPAVPMGGATTTPNVLGLTPSGGVEGPSMRFVADLADVDDTRLVNFMGQSGHVASEHYADQFEPWRRVETRRLPFTPAAGARGARPTPTPLPGRRRAARAGAWISRRHGSRRRQAVDDHRVRPRRARGSPAATGRLRRPGGRRHPAQPDRRAGARARLRPLP